MGNNEADKTRCTAGLILLLALGGLAHGADAGKLYVSPAGKFQVMIPAGYRVFQSGDPSMGSYIPVCDDDAALCVLMPADRYKGTTFGQAAFQVKLIREAETASACARPSEDVFPNLRIEPKERSRLIHGVRFTHATAGGAAMSHYKETNLYRGFAKDTCYEVQINVTYSNFDVYEKGTIREFTKGDKDKVVREITAILDSFSPQILVNVLGLAQLRDTP